MPTLSRFVVRAGILAVLVYAAMWALATFVEPRRGQISVDIPLERLKPQTPPAAP